MKYRVRNWHQFQHYKDRNPPWIKLHFSLLSSPDWVMLDDASRVLAIACMLIASRNDGEIDGSANGLAYLKRVAYLNKQPTLKPLIECGFLECASGMLADASALQANARPETEERQRREETEAEGSVAANAAPTPANVATQGPNRKRRGPLGHFVPEDWTVPLDDYRWAIEQGYPPEFVKRETERFCDHEFKTPRSDWTRAWRNWISKDPPKGGRNGPTFRAA